jgi:hypothetical protein
MGLDISGVKLDHRPICVYGFRKIPVFFIDPGQLKMEERIAGPQCDKFFVFFNGQLIFTAQGVDIGQPPVRVAIAGVMAQ